MHRSPADLPVTLKLGDLVNDLTFVTADGHDVSLSAYAGEAVLLIFLRHLG